MRSKQFLTVDNTVYLMGS